MIIKLRKLHSLYNEETNEYQNQEVSFSETIIKHNKIIGYYHFYFIEDSKKESINITRSGKFVLCEEYDDLVFSFKSIKELKKYIKEYNRKYNEIYKVVVFGNEEVIIEI